MWFKLQEETKRFLVRALLFLLYLSMGMVAFRFLESENETAERRKLHCQIEWLKMKLNVTQEEMNNFVKVVEKAADFGYSNGWVERWSFTGSLFFSGTIITTIGKY